MSGLIERLANANFPENYAELVGETLNVHGANFLSVKDVLYAIRDLSDDQFAEVLAALNSSDQ